MVLRGIQPCLRCLDAALQALPRGVGHQADEQDDSQGSKGMRKYKVEGDKKTGYDLLKLEKCGLWEPVSHHDSRERADQAMTRAKNRDIMSNWK